MEEHAHHHHHHHHHEPHAVTDSLYKVFIVCIALNLLFVFIEAFVGFFFNSLGLLSDAGHNLSDVFSLMLALVAFRLARRPANAHFTYGYKKATILISLLNAVILLVAVGAIIIESIYRFRNAAEVSGEAIGWTAGAGIVVNGLTTWLLMKDRKTDLNVNGAFLHMLMDTLVSVGVVVSGVIISFTGWVWIDSAVSLAIAAIILISTYRLLKESLFLSLDAVPVGIDIEKLKKEIGGTQGVESWHHLHVWAISTTENAATLHIVMNDLSAIECIKDNLKETFRKNGISHCTIECETAGGVCHEMDCCC